MPNTYFNFKEFNVHQDKSSMKICTDACLFGAYIAQAMSTRESSVLNCLDIGTGTGLLSLMYAQKNADTIIHAVEIEKNAYIQAKENFENSKWNNRLTIFHTDIKDFIFEKPYNLIICNPPFYENDLLSTKEKQNLARHKKGLTLKDLIRIIKIDLATNGLFAILLPYHREKYFESLAKENNLFVIEKLLIKQTPSHNFFRVIMLLSNSNTAQTTKELTIKNNDGNYTNEFISLLKDYYLKL